MIICGIDPATEGPNKVTGVAYLDTENRRIKATTFEASGIEKADRYLIEFPMFYTKGKTRARPNDIVALGGRAGYFAGLIEGMGFGKAEFFKPYEWKRQVSKVLCWQRTLLMMSPTELLSVGNINRMPVYMQDDVQDAVSLAMFGDGRKVF